MDLGPTRGVWNLSSAQPSHASYSLRGVCVGRASHNGLGRTSGPLVATSVSPTVLVTIEVAHALLGVCPLQHLQPIHGEVQRSDIIIGVADRAVFRAAHGERRCHLQVRRVLAV